MKLLRSFIILAFNMHVKKKPMYGTANLRNQIFPGIPNPFRESGKSLK